MGGGPWQAVVHGITESQTQLSDFTLEYKSCLVLFQTKWFFGTLIHQSSWAAGFLNRVAISCPNNSSLDILSCGAASSMSLDSVTYFSYLSIFSLSSMAESLPCLSLMSLQYLVLFRFYIDLLN